MSSGDNSNATDDWVSFALTDGALVADLLLRMRLPSTSVKSFFPPLEWTVRQRRSRSVTKLVEPTVTVTTTDSKTKKSGGVASPSTPLSWSAAANSGGSSSGGGRGAECCEEESTLKELFVNSRSKVLITCENNTTTTATTTKRLRKKKTLAELKEEESLLLNEKRMLRNELATVRATFEKQRATNETLKRMKLDILTQKSGGQVVASTKAAKKARVDQTHQTNTVRGTSNIFPTGVACSADGDIPQISPANTPLEVQDTENKRAVFLLPDLNVPVGEDNSPDVLREVS